MRYPGLPGDLDGDGDGGETGSWDGGCEPGGWDGGTEVLGLGLAAAIRPGDADPGVIDLGICPQEDRTRAATTATGPT
jgi:hypothetical protein